MINKSYFKITLLLLTLGVLASCSSVGVRTSFADKDWKQFGLHGKVKTYSERYYKVEKKFGEWEKGDIEIGVHSRALFDSKGNSQYVENYTNNDKFLIKLVPQRENGIVIGDEQYDIDGKMTTKSKLIHHSKVEVEYIAYNKDGNVTSQGRTYITYNNDITCKTVKISKPEELTFVQEFNKDGNPISQKQIDKNGKTVNFQKYVYLAFDKHKNWTKRLSYEPETGEEPVNIAIREYEYY